MKLIIQSLLFIACFFAIWWGLSRVPWLETFNISKFSKKKQEQLGRFIIRAHSADKEQVTNDSVRHLVATIKDKICRANNMDTGTIHIYLFKDQEENAFAIPGDNIIVNTSLIVFCDSPEMLAGVLAHEMGHIRKDHISKKLLKNVGLSALTMMAGGSDNTGSIRKVLETLTSTHFDRQQEKEADALAVVYLKKAAIDPRPLGALFKKMSEKDEDALRLPDWVSTHPDAAERAEVILNTANDSSVFQPVMSVSEWEHLQQHSK